MAKKPRPSINDSLAALAESKPPSTATAPRDDVFTLPRDPVVALPRESVARDDVVVPDGFKRRTRIEKPHASLYAHPKVFKALREIAAAQDCKPHDLYLEGLRHVLQQHGRDFDALNRGE